MFTLMGAISALNEIHFLGFVLGDLKSKNMMVDQYNHLRIIDLGGITCEGYNLWNFTD